MRTRNLLRTRPYFGLTHQLIGLIGLVALMAGGLIGAVLIQNSRNVLRAHILERNLAAADLAGQFAANYINGTETNLRQFATYPSFLRAVFDNDIEQAEMYLAQFLEIDARFDNIAVYDARGIGWASGLMSKWQNRGGSVADREWFQQTLAIKKPYLGIPVLSRGTGRPVDAYAIPIFDDQGEIRAVLVGGISLAALSDVVTGIHVSPAARASLMDSRQGGIILAHLDKKRILTPISGQNAAALRAMTGERGTMETHSSSGELDLVVFAPVPRLPWAVLILEPTDAAFAPVNALTQRALVLIGVTMLVAAVLGVLLARTITHPVQQLVKGAEEIGKGNLDYRIKPRAQDEIGQLAGAFNAMAAERKGAEEALERRVAELNALNAMAVIVTESLDVDEILNRAIVEALRLVGVEAAAMLLLDEKAGELALVAHRGLSDEFVRAFSRMKLGEGLAGRVAQTGKPSVMGDLAEYPGALKAYVEKERIQSAASVPLVGRTGVIGVMNLGAANPHYFDVAGLGLLVVLGRQIGIGVEKARLYAETRRRNRELSVLYTISRALAESLALEKTLNNAIEATLEALNIEAGGIYLLEPDGETMNLRAHRGHSDEFVKGIQRLQVGEGISGKAVLEKRPIVLDISEYPTERLSPLIVRGGFQTMASIPLLSAGQAVGALNLGTRRVRAFPPEELELLTAIGQQLGSAVQNARLYEAVQRELAERKLAEEALQQRTVQLEAANKELEAFSYSVSHDLRAPLRALDGFSRILLEEYASQLPAEARRYLGLVCDNTRQMGRLIDDLLTFSRLSRQPLKKQTVAMADMVQQALAQLHAEQEGRRVEIAIGDPSAGRRGEPVEPSGQALPACEADPALLKQVWVNLLSNALKFTRKREVARIEVGFSPHLAPPQPSPSLSQGEREGEGGAQRREGLGEVGAYFIRDNGVGFDMRYANKLFGVFQRLHRAEEYEGTGVGLAIVQRIIHRHGGRAWAEAEVDKGATFYFTLEGGNPND